MGRRVMSKKAFFCLAFMSASVVSPPALSLSLEEAFVGAYAYNPELKAERARVRGVGERISLASAGWRPRVSVGGDAGYRRTRTSTSGSDYQGSRPRSLGVKLEQDIFSGFQTINRIRASENEERAALAQLLDVEQRIFLDVARAYLDVVRDQALVGLNVNNKQVLARQLEATEDRMRVGELTRTDVSQARARLSGATADHIKAQSQLAVSRARFERLVGDAPREVQYPDEPAVLPSSLEEAVDLARKQQPNVRAATFRAQAAGNTVDAVGGELLPTVTLQADRTNSYNQSNLDGYDTRGYGVSVSVSIPLYQGGGTWSRLQEAEHTESQRRFQVVDARRRAHESVVSAWESLIASRAQIQSLNSQIQAAEVALEGVQKEAQVGSRTVLDVLDSEQELLDARVRLITAQREERVAGYSLLAAVGRLNTDAMGLNIPDSTETSVP